MDKAALTRDVVRALRQVYDPEIPVNIYDLGLIYDITIDDDHKVFIKMTMTAPNCPMSDMLLEDVHTAVADTPGVTDVAIEITFDPPWDKSRMSDEATGAATSAWLSRCLSPSWLPGFFPISGSRRCLRPNRGVCRRALSRS